MRSVWRAVESAVLEVEDVVPDVLLAVFDEVAAATVAAVEADVAPVVPDVCAAATAAWWA